MRLVILILILLIANISFADTFTVTSNADSGPGTLREAIQKAADNGISEVDYIAFNLAGLTKQDRTISILSPLPDLTSNLIIDGSTQPGDNLSINGSKVILDIVLQQSSAELLHTERSSNIEIYGLDFNCYYHSNYCLLFDGVTHLVFGAAGKGNVLHGFSNGILSLLNYSANRDIVIQGNFFGVDETGSILVMVFPMLPCLCIMYMTRLLVVIKPVKET